MRCCITLNGLSLGFSDHWVIILVLIFLVRAEWCQLIARLIGHRIRSHLLRWIACSLPMMSRNLSLLLDSLLREAASTNLSGKVSAFILSSPLLIEMLSWALQILSSQGRCRSWAVRATTSCFLSQRRLVHNWSLLRWDRSELSFRLNCSWQRSQVSLRTHVVLRVGQHVRLSINYFVVCVQELIHIWLISRQCRLLDRLLYRELRLILLNSANICYQVPVLVRVWHFLWKMKRRISRMFLLTQRNKRKCAFIKVWSRFVSYRLI